MEAIQPYLLPTAGAILVTIGLARWFAADIYDVVIVNMTKRWYQEVLERLDNESKIVDIGIGTGTSLIKNSDLIKSKNLKVVGVDYESRYVKKAQANAKHVGLEDSIKVHCASIYDSELNKKLGTNGNFDVAYFSGSFSLLPDPVAALHASAALLKKDESARIYITQTFQRTTTPFLGIVKPLLKYMTTIDFGKLTYESDLDQILTDSKMEILENSVIAGSVDNAFQVARVIVINPRKQASGPHGTAKKTS